MPLVAQNDIYCKTAFDGRAMAFETEIVCVKNISTMSYYKGSCARDSRVKTQ